MIYCNYGRRKDYEWLAKHNIQTHGAIHLIRYGKVHPSNKVRVLSYWHILGEGFILVLKLISNKHNYELKRTT